MLNLAIKYWEITKEHIDKLGYTLPEFNTEKQILEELIAEEVITLAPASNSILVKIKDKNDIKRFVRHALSADTSYFTDYTVVILPDEDINTTEVFYEILSSITNNTPYTVICSGKDEALINAANQSPFFNHAGRKLFLSFEAKPTTEELATALQYVKDNNNMSVVHIKQEDLGKRYPTSIHTSSIRDNSMVSSVFINVSSFHENGELKLPGILQAMNIAVRLAIRGLLDYKTTTAEFKIDTPIEVVLEGMETLIEETSVSRTMNAITNAKSIIFEEVLLPYAAALRLPAPTSTMSATLDATHVPGTFEEQWKEAMEAVQCFANPIYLTLGCAKEDWEKLPQLILDNWEDYEMVAFYDKDNTKQINNIN